MSSPAAAAAAAAAASPPASEPPGTAAPPADTAAADAPARPARDAAARPPEDSPAEADEAPPGEDAAAGGGKCEGGGKEEGPPRRPSRLDAEADKRDRALAEFLGVIDEYTPVIPDLVMDYYLNKAGFDCDDVRTKRLLALAAQKFMSDIATDAYHHCKVRQQGSKKGPTKKTTLTIADLSAALSEHGMNVKKPLFYAG